MDLVVNTQMAETSLELLEEVMARAQEARLSLSCLPLAGRAHILRAMAEALQENAAELIDIAADETHLAPARLEGEVKRTAFQLRLFADLIEGGGFLDARVDHSDAEWPAGAPRPDIRRVLQPIGPVLVFAAGNFPFAFSVAGGDTASALAAGNPVIVKAHHGHPRLSGATADIISRAAEAAGGPADLVQMVYGTEAGVAALSHPAIAAAGFTGSTSGGRFLFDIAQSRPHPIPFFGELGSANPVFVLPGAAATRPAQIAREFLASLTGSQGQLCTKPGVFFVPRASTIREELAGSPVPEALPMLNERTSRSFRAAFAAVSAEEGVRVLWGGDEYEADLFEPTLLDVDIADVLSDPTKYITEIFGPAALVVSYANVDQLADVTAALEGQLTATIIADDGSSEDLAIGRWLVSELALRAGRVIWNDWPTGVSVTHAQNHGGPYPATTAQGATSVGTAAIARFLRPVAYQNVPQSLLPEALMDENPLGVPRLVNGTHKESTR
jgi:NADP-dependent aldehyde dehydrogenase